MAALRGTRILVVEDSQAQCELLRHALAEHGLERVTHVEHGTQRALAFLNGLLESEPVLLPKLLLVDLKLTDGSGVELVRQLRARHRLAHLPIVMLTTSDDPKDIQSSYESGVNGYVVKPTTLDDLVVLVSDLYTYWLRWNQTCNPPSISGSHPARRSGGVSS